MLTLSRGIILDGHRAAVKSIHPNWSLSDSEEIAGFLRAAIEHHAPPPNLEGEAVIYPLYESGQRAHVGILVALRMLRDTGYAGRVQLWHAGSYPDLCGLGVELRDMRAVRGGGSHASWASKSFALQHCGLHKALVVDWDCYLVRDPQPIFDALDNYGMLWWGPNCQHAINWEIYRQIGLTRFHEPVQGGFLAYNCRDFWHEIMVQRYYDNHAAWWWPRIGSGDEGGWRIIVNLLRPNARQEKIYWENPTWINLFDGAAIAVHRCGGKLWPERMPRWNQNLPGEKQVIAHYKELLGREEYKRLAFAGRCRPSRGRPPRIQRFRLV